MPAGFAKLTLGRLRLMLSVLFIGLAVPAAALVLQAYRQSEFETFYRYQQEATAFAERLDIRLAAALAELERYDAGDYGYFADPESGSPLRSPLAALPPRSNLPGVIGYFRLGPNGRLSTPFLPDSTADRERAALSAEDYARRVLKFDEVRNALEGAAFGGGGLPASPVAATAEESTAGPTAESRRADSSSPADADIADRETQASVPRREPAARSGALTASAQETTAGLQSRERRIADSAQAQSLGKLRDLDLDESLQKKSEARQVAEDFAREPNDVAEIAATLEEAEAAPGESLEFLPAEVRIDTFASGTEPWRFGLLGPGRAALVRSVWKGGERNLLGVLIDLDALLDEGISGPFGNTALSGMSSLVVALGDDVVRIVDGDRSQGYPAAVSSLDGDLLYRTRLTDPFDSLTLLFSVTELSAGAATGLLGWTAAALVLVLGGGFFGLYRVGITQIRLAQQQQDFVAAVSHELKTPLTSIRMYGEMLQSGWVDDDRRKSYYAYIHDESERLSRLIDNVLQLARISRQGMQFDLKPVAVTELVDMCRSKLAESAKRAGFEFAVTVDDAVASDRVTVDTDCFLQIAINLVDNAIKFARGCDPARIDCRFFRVSDAELGMSVRDYGPGIQRSQLKRIFELFYRPNSELTRETVGTGIGLAIVSTLARGMGGDVDVANRDPGAEFTVTFRLAETPP